MEDVEEEEKKEEEEEGKEEGNEKQEKDVPMLDAQQHTSIHEKLYLEAKLARASEELRELIRANASEAASEEMRLVLKLGELAEEKRRKARELVAEHDFANTTHLQRQSLRALLAAHYDVHLPSNDFTHECKSHAHPQFITRTSLA